MIKLQESVKAFGIEFGIEGEMNVNRDYTPAEITDGPFPDSFLRADIIRSIDSTKRNAKWKKRVRRLERMIENAVDSGLVTFSEDYMDNEAWDYQSAPWQVRRNTFYYR